MSDNLQDSFKEIDRDLDRSWIELSGRVRDLASGLKLKAAGTSLSQDANHLSQEVAFLCDHLERLHADVIDLLQNVETHLPLPEPDPSAPGKLIRVEPDEVAAETIRIQRETHELRGDFKDILKALFMWRDDPAERVREKR